MAELALRQGGAVELGQLRAIGATDRTVEQRLASGHLHPKHLGVYAVGHPLLTPDGRRWAAVLTCGEGARLSHWSNAVHRGLLTGDGPSIDVTIPTHRFSRQSGIKVRRAILEPHEVEVVRGLPCTSVPRMLLELAATKRADVVERAWRQAVYERVLDVASVAELLERRRGERGIVLLRSLYDRRSTIVGRLKGHTEDLLLPIIRRTSLGEPISNADICVGYRELEVDFYFPSLKLVIEGDGRQAHEDPEQIAADALRDDELRAIGLHVHRVPYADARWCPHLVEATLNRVSASLTTS